MKEKAKIVRSKLEQDRIDDRKRWVLFAIFSALIPDALSPSFSAI